jgi:hypothetical protein
MAGPRSVGRAGEQADDRSNLRPSGVPLLSWAKPDAVESLATLYAVVEGQAVEAIDWYLNEKKSKSHWSRGLRVAAILLGAAGALIPLLNLVNNQVLDVRWGYVAFALAAAAVALDRFFGFSSGWMRYLITSFRLQRLLADFQFEWATRSARLEGSTPEPEQVTELLTLLRKVLSAILNEVERETIAWAEEFQSNLGGIDRNLQEASVVAGQVRPSAEGGAAGGR